MKTYLRIFLAASLLLSLPLLQAQVKESSVTKQLENMRNLSAAQRPKATIKLAQDIRTLPAGIDKLKYADALSHLVTEGDPGMEAITEVANTLSQALQQSPLPAKEGRIPSPYMDLARLARYERAPVTLNDPLYAKAMEMLAANDADVEKADFTLKDLKNKPVTLSALRGKIVLVSFWATWCPPCRMEMPVLDAIYKRFQSQDLVILSITSDTPFKVNSMVSQMGYHPTVLLDEGGKVHKQFHIQGLPRTFVYNREGKLVAQAVDLRTPRQFLAMLAAAGLHP